MQRYTRMHFVSCSLRPLPLPFLPTPMIIILDIKEDVKGMKQSAFFSTSYFSILQLNIYVCGYRTLCAISSKYCFGFPLYYFNTRCSTSLYVCPISLLFPSNCLARLSKISLLFFVIRLHTCPSFTPSNSPGVLTYPTVMPAWF